MQTLSPSQSSPEVPVNENFETLSHQACYGKRQPATGGLTWGYYGGRWGGFTVADGTVTLSASTTNYLVVAIATGVLSVATTTTNWNDTANYVRVYKLTTAAAAVSAIEDHRAGPSGVHGNSSSSGGGLTSVAASGGVQTASGSPITGTGTLRAAHLANAQTGTSYAFLATDRWKRVSTNNGSAIAATIAQAGTTGFEDGYGFFWQNLGAGTATLTPTTSTINGASSLALSTGQAAIVFSDGANYRAIVVGGGGSFAGGKLTSLLSLADPVYYSTVTSNVYDVGLANSNSLQFNSSGGTINYLGVTAADGTVVSVFFSSGGQTLTHNATYFSLPNNGANIVTAAGDVGLFLKTGSGAGVGNWLCLSYVRANGSALQSASLSNFTESAQNGDSAYQSQLVAKNTGQSNVDLVLTPKGTGALSADVPTGNYLGGMARGQYAVDWQRLRAAGDESASAYASAIGGGEGNSAKANYATIPGGRYNQADAADSQASGSYGWTRGMIGCRAFGSGAASVRGSRQSRDFILSAKASGTTPVVLTSDGAAAGNSNQIGLKSTKTTGGSIRIRGQALIMDNNVTGYAGGFDFAAVAVLNPSATAFSLQGSAVVSAYAGDSSLSAATLAITTDNTNRCFVFTFTGIGGVNITCIVEGTSVELDYT